MSEEQNKPVSENEQENLNDIKEPETVQIFETESDESNSEITEENNELTESSELDSEAETEAKDSEATEVIETAEEKEIADETEIVSSGEKNTASSDKSSKWKSVLYPSTVVAFVLVIVSIAVFGIYTTFFQTSVKGAWISTEIEEVTSSDSFLVLGDNNVAYMAMGNMRYMGNYSTSYDDAGEKILTVNIPNIMQTTFKYEMKDNNILSLSVEGDETEYTFKNVQIPDSRLPVPDDYKRDALLYGTWRDNNYGIEYTFREDGTMLINEAGVVEADCIYDIQDNTIHVEYWVGETYTMDMEYTVENGKLEIGSMSFVKIIDKDGNTLNTEATETQSIEETTVEQTTEA